MSRLIENNFRRTSDNTFIAKKRQIWFSFIGGIGLTLWVIFFTPMVWEGFRLGFYIGAVVGIICYIGIAGMLLLFIAISLPIHHHHRNRPFFPHPPYYREQFPGPESCLRGFA